MLSQPHRRCTLRPTATLANWRTDRKGGALVEFALLLPVLIGLLIGILAYGQYFLLAHSVQQIANDAARATLAGLNRDERRDLARRTVAQEATALPDIPARSLVSGITETATSVIVAVRLDARDMPLFQTALVPMPSPIVERRALIRKGDVL